MRELVLAAALTFSAAVASADEAARSGIYGSLTLVVNGNTVSGVFDEQRGGGPIGGPQFSCIFLLRGTLAGSRAAVETWFPGESERIPGELVFNSEGIALKLREDHGGCPMTTGSMAEQPYAMQRDEEGTGWAGVALVTAKRTSFRSAPGAPAPRAPYVVSFDPLVVLERQSDWVRVSYRGATKPITGWLPTSDLALVP